MMIYTLRVMIYHACGLDKQKAHFWQTKVCFLLAEKEGFEVLRTPLAVPEKTFVPRFRARSAFSTAALV